MSERGHVTLGTRRADALVGTGDLLLGNAFDDVRCRELVHADVRATLTAPWLRTLSDFLA